MLSSRSFHMVPIKMSFSFLLRISIIIVGIVPCFHGKKLSIDDDEYPFYYEWKITSKQFEKVKLPLPDDAPSVCIRIYDAFFIYLSLYSNNLSGATKFR